MSALEIFANCSSDVSNGFAACYSQSLDLFSQANLDVLGEECAQNVTEIMANANCFSLCDLDCSEAEDIILQNISLSDNCSVVVPSLGIQEICEKPIEIGEYEEYENSNSTAACWEEGSEVVECLLDNINGNYTCDDLEDFTEIAFKCAEKCDAFNCTAAVEFLESVVDTLAVTFEFDSCSFNDTALEDLCLGVDGGDSDSSSTLSFINLSSVLVASVALLARN